MTDKFDDIDGTGIHAIMLGNPVDGYRFVGPFKLPSEAIGWAMGNVQADWWPIALESPKDFTQ